MSLIKAIFDYFVNLFSSKGNQLSKFNRNNLDIEALLNQYKDKVNKELKEANNRLDEFTANMNTDLDKASKIRAELAVTVEAIKAASKIEDKSPQVINDIRLMKANAKSKLELAKIHEARADKLKELTDEMVNTITDAKINANANINALEIALINNTIADISNEFADIKVDGFNVDEIIEIVNGKRALLEAKKQNDQRLGRVESKIEKSYVDQSDEISEELEAMLR